MAKKTTPSVSSLTGAKSYKHTAKPGTKVTSTKKSGNTVTKSYAHGISSTPKRTTVRSPGGTTISTTTAPPSAGTSGGSSRRPKARRTPPTPREKTIAQIQRRALSGKKLTPKQDRVLSYKPKLEKSIAQRRAKAIVPKATKPLGIKKAKVPKLPVPVVKKLARGGGEAKLLRSVVKAQPKAKQPPPKKVKEVAQKVARKPPVPKAPKRQAPAQPKKKGKVTVEVPAGVPDEYKKWVARYGTQYLSDVGAKHGLSGPEYFAKILQFESGWNPNAQNAGSGATGLGQFIPSTREDFVERLGVDPYASPKKNLEASAMHLSGKFGYGEGYEGYNPGYGDYDAPLREDVGPTVRVKVPRKATEGVSTGGQAKKVKGAWAGSKKVIDKTLKGIVDPSEYNADKRTPEENSAVGGSSTSDHLTTSTGAFAADLPASDEIAQRIAKKLGMASHVGTNEVTINGYRHQLIWQDAGHYDHVHYGVRWTGEDAPPGTSFGGPAGSVSTTGATAGGAVGAAPTTTSSGTMGTGSGASRKRKKRKTSKRRAAGLALLEQGTPVVDVDVDFDRDTDSYATHVKRKSASLSL